MTQMIYGWDKTGSPSSELLVSGAYPDGTPIIQHPTTVSVSTILARTTDIAGLMSALFLADAFEERGGSPRPRLVLPYVPGARQDRLNPAGDYLFTAKSVAREINARNFESVSILDPHSEVIAGLIDRCVVHHAAEFINPPAGKYHAVLSPDAGAEKRASAVAKKLGVPLIHAWKRRNVTTGTLDGFGFDETGFQSIIGFGAKVLVVDDICDGGGTFVGLADAIRAAGHTPEMVTLHLWVTHGLFTKGTDELLKRYHHVYTTDSVDHGSATVIEVTACAKITGVAL